MLFILPIVNAFLVLLLAVVVVFRHIRSSAPSTPDAGPSSRQKNILGKSPFKRIVKWEKKTDDSFVVLNTDGAFDYCKKKNCSAGWVLRSSRGRFIMCGGCFIGYEGSSVYAELYAINSALKVILTKVKSSGELDYPNLVLRSDCDEAMTWLNFDEQTVLRHAESDLLLSIKKQLEQFTVIELDPIPSEVNLVAHTLCQVATQRNWVDHATYTPPDDILELLASDMRGDLHTRKKRKISQT